MPVPTAYTESLFAAYLVSTLDTLEQVLEWDQGDPRVREAVVDTLLDYGTSDIASVSSADNIRKLRALGRRSIWRAVAAATAVRFSFSDVTQKFERQQVHDHAVAMFKMADDDCREWDATYAVSSSGISRTSDPYSIVPDEERVA